MGVFLLLIENVSDIYKYMFDLSEQNITILLVCFGIVFILFLSARAPRKCVREGMNLEYQKMFEKSNKVLCPDNDGHLFSEEEED